MIRRETAEDRSKEDEVAEYVARIWKCEQFSNGELAHIDRSFTRAGKLVALVEIKCRNVAKDAYPTYMISYRKVKDGLFQAGMDRVPFILVVKWLNSIGWVKIEERGLIIRPGGRTDRGDPADIEDCVHIPIASFREVT